MSDSRPIGIFDSGIGGLTIARAIHKLMPQEELMFFGDTAHLPYGDKSAEAIRGYVHRITELLLQKGCKIVVIACNSASAAAYNYLHKEFGNQQPILNVIDPIIQHVAGSGKYRTVGVIGTKATVSSKVFPRKFHSANADLTIKSMATPLLASMIEEGYFNNNISQTIINSYLSNKKLSGIEALVLACTHYPLIKKEISTYFDSVGQQVDIIDSMEVMARYTQQKLTEYGMLNEGDKAPLHHFYVSDFTTAFQKTTNIFFGQAVKLEHIPIWQEKES